MLPHAIHDHTKASEGSDRGWPYHLRAPRFVPKVPGQAGKLAVAGGHELIFLGLV
jgi:hypothetical protein